MFGQNSPHKQSRPGATIMCSSLVTFTTFFFFLMVTDLFRFFISSIISFSIFIFLENLKFHQSSQGFLYILEPSGYL